MSTLARLAVGSLQPGVDPQVAIWALREGLGRNGIQVQSYLSRACFPRNPAETSLTGLTVRHLDSWLMSPEICRDIFVRGAERRILPLSKADSARPPIATSLAANWSLFANGWTCRKS